MDLNFYHCIRGGNPTREDTYVKFRCFSRQCTGRNICSARERERERERERWTELCLCVWGIFVLRESVCVRERVVCVCVFVCVWFVCLCVRTCIHKIIHTCSLSPFPHSFSPSHLSFSLSPSSLFLSRSLHSSLSFTHKSSHFDLPPCMIMAEFSVPLQWIRVASLTFGYPIRIKQLDGGHEVFIEVRNLLSE